MSGLAVDASQPKPPLTPLTFVSIPSLISLVFDRYPLGTSIGRSLDFTSSSMDTVMRKSGCCTTRLPAKTCTLLSCWPEIDRFATTILVIEFSHGLAVNFIPTFYEIVNVEQQLAFRCFIGREQCEQAFVVRIFSHSLQPTNPQSSLPSTSLVPDTSQQISVSTRNSCRGPTFG